MRLIIFLTCLSLVRGYHILCIQSIPSRSHYNLMYGIVKPLMQAGHEITMLTAYPESKTIKNLTMIDVSHVKAITKVINVLDKSTMGLRVVSEFARNVSNTVASSPTVKDILVNKNFDAVVSEWFVTDADAGYAAVQQAPWILLQGTIISPLVENLVDTVRSIPSVPLMFNDADIPMSFWQRIKNTVMFSAMLLDMLIQKPVIESDYDRNFGPIAKARGIPLPSLDAAKHNISILFVNSHPSIAPAHSLPPNVVDIAGYHIDDVTPLPKDLQQLLDSSTQGFIYFSMGSVVKTSGFTDKTKRDLVRIFRSLPYTVLWKFDGTLQDLPKNLHVRPWMPQSSILSHPNIKLFITHGGLLSIIESLNFGVPILSLPVFGDQPSNADRAMLDGYGLKVDFSEDMHDDLSAAVTEMTSNDSYYKRAKAVSAMFRSRPVETSRLIQHHVEVAIQSKGAYHLRSKSQLYTWYQLLMLDQLAFFMVIGYILYRIVKKVCTSVKYLLSSDKSKID